MLLNHKEQCFMSGSLTALNCIFQVQIACQERSLLDQAVMSMLELIFMLGAYGYFVTNLSKHLNWSTFSNCCFPTTIHALLGILSNSIYVSFVVEVMLFSIGNSKHVIIMWLQRRFIPSKFNQKPRNVQRRLVS